MDYSDGSHDTETFEEDNISSYEEDDISSYEEDDTSSDKEEDDIVWRNNQEDRKIFWEINQNIERMVSDHFTNIPII